MAQDFDDIMADLEMGAIELRHPERMSQRQYIGKRQTGAATFHSE